jgi:hypothetical protein
MHTDSRAELSRRISLCLAEFRAERDPIARTAAFHTLVGLEAELAALDRAASRSEADFDLAPCHRQGGSVERLAACARNYPMTSLSWCAIPVDREILPVDHPSGFSGGGLASRTGHDVLSDVTGATSEESQVVLPCFMCGNCFQFNHGKHIARYMIDVCDGCYNSNSDGWQTCHETQLLIHLAAKGLPFPDRNAKGWLPRD